MSEEKLQEPKTALQEAAAKVKEQMALVKAEDQVWMEALDNFDWKHLPPHRMADVLTKKPYRSRTGGIERLTAIEALFFAMRCFELGLSPLSSEVWFNRETWTVNVTTEGKRRLARLQNLDLGACKKKRVVKPFPDVPPALQSERVVALKAAGYTTDVGYQGTLPVGNKGEVEYTAWLSEWYMPYSPVWRERPEHMLQVRCEEKCITFASGIGISEMPDEREIEGKVEAPLIPSIDVQAVEYKPQEEKAK